MPKKMPYAGLLAIGFCAQALPAQQMPLIYTVAGTTWQFSASNNQASMAPLGPIPAVAVDAQGNFYAPDTGNNIVVEIAPNGSLTVVAGNGTAGFSGDGGNPTSASLNGPTGVAVDLNGNVYIADTGNNRIRKVVPATLSTNATITTVAGNGKATFAGDGGNPTNASLNMPDSVAVDSSGNIYIADTLNNRVRKVSGGAITTVAGTGTAGFSGDNGPAASASLNQPEDVAVDLNGNLYIADTLNNRIRKVSGTTIATIAGSGTPGFSGDQGPATGASLADPAGVAVDLSGNLYIADSGNGRIRKVTTGTIATIAGNGSQGFSGDNGPATSAAFFDPEDVVVDLNGNLYIADTGNDRIRKVTPAGTISTVAGDGDYRFSGDGEPATSASLYGPTGVALDSAGNLYIGDTSNNRVRKLTAAGVISTVAGNGLPSYSGDAGSATGASLFNPTGVAVDTSGNVYIADSFNNRIRKVTTGGIVSTVAGSGLPGYSGDGGSATTASLFFPSGVAVDSSNNLYIADTGNNAIRKVSAGSIATVVKASLNGPGGVAVDGSGNLYIADTGNNRVVKFSGGTIATVAGNGLAGFSGDNGSAIGAAINAPAGVTVDSSGNVYIADTGNNRVRKVGNGVISTVAGNGNPGYSGDGVSPILTSLNSPSGVAVDAAGDLYIADTGNNRIRDVSSAAVTYQVAPGSLTFIADQGGAPPASQTLTLTSPAAGLSFTVTSSNAWLSASPTLGAFPVILTVTADPGSMLAGSYSGTITVSVPNAALASVSVAVTFTILPPKPASLGADTGSLNFNTIQGGNGAIAHLDVLNLGGQILPFTATATTSSGGGWLTLSSTLGMPPSTSVTGSATAANPAFITVNANPGNLLAGTYSGAIAITGAGSTIVIPVTLTVSPPASVLVVSQFALQFYAAAGTGSIPLPGQFGILNTGEGSMNWTAVATALSGGDWLQISTNNGVLPDPFDSVSLVQVSVNPAGLAAGTYYGQIQVYAAGAPNSPQGVNVILTVLPPGFSLPPQIFPSGVIFSGEPGSSPGPMTVNVVSSTGQTITYQSSSIGSFYSYRPQIATVAPNAYTPITVYPDFSEVPPETLSRGTITLQFSDRSPSETISVLILTGPPGEPFVGFDKGSGGVHPLATTSACASQPLQIVFRSLQANFTATVGQPTTLDIAVSDGCGNPVGSSGASVGATFSDGDAQVAMVPIGGGIWQGTWKPQNAASPVAMHVAAYLQQGNLGLVGAATLNGTVSAPSPSVPTPNVTSVALASGQGGTPITPGGLITIFGSNLATGSPVSANLPWPQQVGGTQVFLGDQPLPFLYVSPTQLNVQVPYSAPVNTQYQLTVQNGNTLSVPQQMVVAAAQPGIFTINQQGTGQGAIVKSDGVTVAEAMTPANIGDTVVIYCTGLGAVSPAVTEGTPAPTLPLSQTVNTVTVTIGGQPAVVSFSGLTPGSAGLYQVNAVVPAGITTGNAVPVTIAVAGQTSPTVTMAVE